MSQTRNLIMDFFNNIQAALGIALSTLMIGIMETWDLFDKNAGTIAAFLGTVLTRILIIAHLRNIKKTNLEIDLLQRRKADKIKRS